MLRLFKALVACVAACFLINVLLVSRAMADDGTGGMQCSDPSNPKCVVRAGTPGKPGNTGVDQPTSNGSGGYCIYKRIDNLSPDTLAALGGQPSGPGAWYDRICYDANGNVTRWTANWPIWL